MDTMDCRSELHVAQQSRREKLRVHQINDMSSAWDNTLSVQHQMSSNPALVPPGLIGFVHNQIAKPVQPDAYQDCTAMLMNNPQGSDPQGCSVNWKMGDCDNWTVTNYVDDQTGRVSHVGDVFSNNLNTRNCILDHVLHGSSKVPSYDACENITQSSMSSSEICGQDHDHHGKSQLNPLYHDGFQNLVTVACSGMRSKNDNAECTNYDRGVWSETSSSREELVFLPSYGNQRLYSWMNRPAGSNINSWTLESGYELSRQCDLEDSRNLVEVSAEKSLSLSLSPEIPKPCIINKSSGKSFANAIDGGAAAAATSSVFGQRYVGPLGPFTGYATILKSSRFLKPAQELLDEFCSLYVSKISGRCQISNSIDILNLTAAEECDGKGKDDSLSSMIESCNGVGRCSSSSDALKPENQANNAKLNLLQEEVCRRYKLYNQQIQMVVSSFESVAGLSTATPYISLAMTRISRGFKNIRNMISDQLIRISRVSGHEHGPNQTCNTNNSYQKLRSSILGNHVGLHEPQSQHVWKPQRGLPERAVVILRAWLFEHFLHPYPTDTDKQMLATQTGLSRNQVSNWFINARVRVWKPMVEEMHMLETQAMGAATESNNQTPTRTNQTNNIAHYSNRPPCPNTFCQNETNKEPMEIQGSSLMRNGLAEKRSEVEYTRGSVDVPSVLGLMPNSHHRGVFEGGLGNVSLTLGLRHETQAQMLTHDHQRLGGSGQMAHDFVG